MAVTAALLAGVTVASLNWWRCHRLGQDHAVRAQKAFDAMYSHYENIKLLSYELKRTRLRSDKARYEAMMKSSQRRLVKLEETAARHERLARYYGHKAPFKRPEQDPGP